MQDCSNSSALAMELLQSSTEPSICCTRHSDDTWMYLQLIKIYLLQVHSKYNTTGVFVPSWLMWTSPHYLSLTTSPLCLLSPEHAQH